MHRPHRDPITRDAFVDALRQRGLADFEGLVEHCLRLRAPAVTAPVAPVGRAELVERFFGEEARTRAKATARSRAPSPAHTPSR